MKRVKLRKAGSVLSAGVLTAALALGSVSVDGITAEAEVTSGDVLAAFENPDSDAKPMVRWWFPDSWSGTDDDDMIEETIQELAAAGYGGVEITMLADGSNMDLDELSDYGWGTDSYVEMLKKALKAANKIDGGFTVDITITAHWPTIMNNVDPNDDAASQELIYTTQSVDTSSGITSVSLELPETKLYDSTEITNAAFIFTDTLVDAYLVKSNGSNGYDYDSAVKVTDYITETYAHAAGVPDEEAFAEWYASYYDDLDSAYETYVLDIYGEAPDDDADLTVSYNGKQDADGHRARMADTQYDYTLDTTKLSEEVQEGLASGEYTLVSTYKRGTGQNQSGSGADLMYSRAYVTNYFSEEGTDALLEYWNNNILSDPELVELLEENGSSIFEDSIEASTKSGGSFWSDSVISRFEQDYGEEIGENLPLIVALSSQLTSSEIDIDDAKTSYQITLGNLYDEVHSAKISEWTSTFNYSYRAQCYAITGQDIISSESSVDIPEGDNSYKGDGLRAMASVVNVDDKDSLSMEAATGSGNLQLNWADVVTEVAQNYSDGVNHVVLHGSPYTKSVTGLYASWPGWLAFFGCMICDSYTTWRADYDDMYKLTGYMARTQAVLQEGTAKVDVLFLNDSSSGSSLTSGNSFQDLLNEGYSYNMTSEALLESENAVVTNGVLAEDGPAYKALILNSVSKLSSEAMETIVEYAEAGLPIVLYNCNISDVYGLETDTNTKAALLEAYNKLLTYSNVKSTSSKSEISTVLAELGVSSDATSEADYLEISHYEDESNGSDYYYLFNNPQETSNNSGMISAGQNSKYKNGADITTTVTLSGEGVPYELDAWTGEVTPIAAYTDNGDGTISVEVTLEGGESTIIALLNEKSEIVHVTAADENVEYDSDGNLVYKSNETGTVSLALSNGTSAEVTIENTLESLDLTNGWSLKIESYGPSADIDDEENVYSVSSAGNTIYVDPTLTDITTENFDIDTLTLWENIEATADQLENLGVSSMDSVVGVGYYTNTFTLPDSWDDTTGAILNLEYSQDMVMSVTVNDTLIDVVDNVSDQVDIGEYLQSGENTIVIKMATPMYNRVSATDRMTMYSNIDYGLTSVTLTPYTTVAIMASEEEDDSELAEAKSAAEVALAALESYQSVDDINSDNLADVESAISAANAAVAAYVALGGSTSELTGYEYLAGAQAAWDAYWKAVEEAEALEKELAAAKETAEVALAALADYQTEDAVTADNYSDVVVLVETANTAVNAYLELGGTTADLTNYAYIEVTTAILEAYAEGDEQSELLEQVKADALEALAALAEYQTITAENYEAAAAAIANAGYIIDAYVSLGGTAEDLEGYDYLTAATTALNNYEKELAELESAKAAAEEALAALAEYETITAENYETVQALIAAAKEAVASYAALGGTESELTGYESLTTVQEAVASYESSLSTDDGDDTEDSDDTGNSGDTDDTDNSDDADDEDEDTAGDADDSDDSDSGSSSGTSSTSGTSTSSTAKTGDNSPIAMSVVVLCLAAAAIAAAVLIRKKKSVNM